MTITRPVTGRRPARTRVLAFVLLFAVLGALGGLAFGSRLKPTASASASVLVQPLPGNAFASRAGDVSEDMETEAQLPKSDVVLRRVAASERGLPIPQVRPRLSVRTVANAGVLVIAFRGPSAGKSLEVVAEVANQTLAVRRERAATVNAERAAALESYISESEADLEAALSAEPRRRAVVRTLSDRLVVLREDLRRVTGPEPDSGSVLGVSARSGGSPVLPAAVLGAGVLLGAVIGWLVGRRPRRRRWSIELTAAPTASSRERESAASG